MPLFGSSRIIPFGASSLRGKLFYMAQDLIPIKIAEKKTRKPKSYDNIANGAMKLSLEDKVSLRNCLTESIDQELKKMENDFNVAKKLITGQQ